jgi:hypothetical protein
VRRVTVTQLVDFAKCEKLAILKLTHKEMLNEERSRAVSAGIEAHGQLERQLSVDGRCFIASFACGSDAPETIFLRHYRDNVLQVTRLGRIGIRFYYFASPYAVHFLRLVPHGKRLSFWCVRTYIRWVGGE